MASVHRFASLRLSRPRRRGIGRRSRKAIPQNVELGRFLATRSSTRLFRRPWFRQIPFMRRLWREGDDLSASSLGAATEVGADAFEIAAERVDVRLSGAARFFNQIFVLVLVVHTRPSSKSCSGVVMIGARKPAAAHVFVILVSSRPFA